MLLYEIAWILRTARCTSVICMGPEKTQCNNTDRFLNTVLSCEMAAPQKADANMPQPDSKERN